MFCLFFSFTFCFFDCGAHISITKIYCILYINNTCTVTPVNRHHYLERQKIKICLYGQISFILRSIKLSEFVPNYKAKWRFIKQWHLFTEWPLYTGGCNTQVWLLEMLRLTNKSWINIYVFIVLELFESCLNLLSKWQTFCLLLKSTLCPFKCKLWLQHKVKKIFTFCQACFLIFNLFCNNNHQLTGIKEYSIKIFNKRTKMALDRSPDPLNSSEQLPRQAFSPSFMTGESKIRPLEC
jgi:hypothetical protein